MALRTTNLSMAGNCQAEAHMKHIMVIDDSVTIRTSVEYALKELGYFMDHAENGSDALAKVKNIKDKGGDVALCIVDVNMPVMDGITFITEFRRLDKFTPVLVLTTESEERKIKAGKLAGASGWIVKPFRNQDMVNVVQKLIR
jgi:two-component system chemotaxis response regulator CheY